MPPPSPARLREAAEALASFRQNGLAVYEPMARFLVELAERADKLAAGRAPLVMSTTKLDDGTGRHVLTNDLGESFTLGPDAPGLVAAMMADIYDPESSGSAGFAAEQWSSVAYAEDDTEDDDTPVVDGLPLRATDGVVVQSRVPALMAELEASVAAARAARKGGAGEGRQEPTPSDARTYTMPSEDEP